jgi:hypothetical protein
LRLFAAGVSGFIGSDARYERINRLCEQKPQILFVFLKKLLRRNGEQSCPLLQDCPFLRIFWRIQVARPDDKKRCAFMSLYDDFYSAQPFPADNPEALSHFMKRLKRKTTTTTKTKTEHLKTQR